MLPAFQMYFRSSRRVQILECILHNCQNRLARWVQAQACSFPFHVGTHASNKHWSSGFWEDVVRWEFSFSCREGRRPTSWFFRCKINWTWWHVSGFVVNLYTVLVNDIGGHPGSQDDANQFPEILNECFGTSWILKITRSSHEKNHIIKPLSFRIWLKSSGSCWFLFGNLHARHRSHKKNRWHFPFWKRQILLDWVNILNHLGWSMRMEVMGKQPTNQQY